jgi:transcriptional regulator with XRE-family HTH domain
MKNSRVKRHYEKIMKQHGYNLQDMAALAGVSVAAVSRVLKGQFSPSVPQIQTIASELGNGAGAELIADFCRDLIPRPFLRQIRIQVMPDNKKCLSTERLPGALEFLDEQGLEMIEKLVQLILENPALLDQFVEEINLLYDPHDPKSK